LGLRRGEVKWFPWYGVLVGLIYHVHIALAPLAPIPLLAYLGSKGSINEKWKQTGIKMLVVSMLTFLICSSPFWLFEIKHNFSQVRSTLTATKIDFGYVTGWAKVKKIVNASGRELQQRLSYGWDFKPSEAVWLLVAGSMAVIVIKKKINRYDMSLLILWLAVIAGVQYGSKRLVSEYYFTNIIPVIILMISLALDEVYNWKMGKILVLTVGLWYLTKNTIWLLDYTNNSTEALSHKLELVRRVKEEAAKEGYDCVGINYISKLGDGVGFRYLWWYEGVKVGKPGPKVPTYNIVVPWEISGDEIEEKFGRYGLIKPKERIQIEDGWCERRENQVDPMLGYTE
jgi:hypothetical protein